MEILTKYAIEIFFGLVSAGALAFCKHLSAQIKEYKKLLELRENESINKAIDERIIPVKDELERKIETFETCKNCRTGSA